MEPVWSLRIHPTSCPRKHAVFACSYHTLRLATTSDSTNHIMFQQTALICEHYPIYTKLVQHPPFFIAGVTFWMWGPCWKSSKRMAQCHSSMWAPLMVQKSSDKTHRKDGAKTLQIMGYLPYQLVSLPDFDPSTVVVQICPQARHHWHGLSHLTVLFFGCGMVPTADISWFPGYILRRKAGKNIHFLNLNDWKLRCFALPDVPVPYGFWTSCSQASQYIR